MLRQRQFGMAERERRVQKGQTRSLIDGGRFVLDFASLRAAHRPSASADGCCLLLARGKEK